MQARERGVVMIVVVISLLAVLAMAGLAIDISQTLSTKARLQSVVDAAALAGAKVLDQTGSKTSASAAALDSVQKNAQAFPTLRDSGVLPVIEFAAAATPFEPEAAGTPRFVRVKIESLPVAASLIRVLGIEALAVRASALAGPSPPLELVCNVLPVVLCATGDSEPFGYTAGNVYALKASSTALGGGNYGLLNFEGSVRENLAGGYNQCLSVGETVRTKPGDTSGPTAQGLNTRFNRYSGGGLNARDYPPDVIIREPAPAVRLDSSGQLVQGTAVISSAAQLDYNHGIYRSQLAAANYSFPPRPAGNAVFGRREVVVPIAECGAAQPVIRGFGCFFLLQGVDQSQADIFGEFIEACEAGGRPGSQPGSGGPYIIQLYRDPASADS